MKISPILLKNELSKRSEKAKLRMNSQINYKLLEYVYSRTNVSLIDFDSFSQQDIINLSGDTQGIDDENLIDDLYGLWYNPIYEFHRSTNINYDLHRSKKKIYESKDDFI
ncbi:hypothetical protein D5F52_26425 (plasmid) [Brevibacillus laterosporus]|uniref:hypothetical protein n=1 Tax=Brevibacillus laterosporus TaxID=1465 RepID=UPI000E6B9B39|nr:hypothetical protein [Brevibacillus laterosporus]AYB41693.1 hypothetical protein D5F52_26425 [Brevibacillus laterosporus]